MIYPIIKGGVISHCRQMSSFYASYDLRVNCISPGGLEGKIKGIRDLQDKRFKKNYLNKVPLNRFCKTTDISEACLFLLDQKSSYITGQNIVIDGGLSII